MQVRNYKLAHIYGLQCPISNEIRYVGKTVLALNRRLNMHINHNRGNCIKKQWIEKLKLSNLFPKIMLLQTVNYDDWRISEMNWISKYNNLLNENKGGGGGHGQSNDYSLKYKQYLLGRYSKNTVKNYHSAVRIFLINFNKLTSSPCFINSKQILIYLDHLKDKNTQKFTISALKLFFDVIVNQPKKFQYIKYNYK